MKHSYRVYTNDTDYEDYLDTMPEMYLTADVVDGHANIYANFAGLAKEYSLVASYPPMAWTKLIAVAFDK